MSDSVTGKNCPFCSTPIKEGRSAVVCADCGMPHHEECWRENGGCTTFGCRGQASTFSGGASVSASSGATSGLATAFSHPAADHPPRASKRRTTVLASVGAIVVLLAGVGLGVSLRGNGSESSTHVTSATPAIEPSDVTETGIETDDRVETYIDPSYHYTFDYPSAWELQQGGTADVSAGGNAAASVGVYDPKGAVAGETYIDMVQVSVYELNVAVDESLMPEIKAEVESVLASLESQAGDLKTVEPLAEASVGDMYGYKVTYSFAKNNAPVISTLYFMFFGDKEYQITAQAADENWEASQAVFRALIDSFRPPEHSSTAK